MAKKKSSSTTTPMPADNAELRPKKRRRHSQIGMSTTTSHAVSGNKKNQPARLSSSNDAKTKAGKSTKKTKSQAIDARSLYLGPIKEANPGADAGLTLLDDTFAYKFGLPIPLPLQFVIGCGVMPLGVVMEVNGPPMSMKTAFSYEMGRIFIQNAGMLFFLVTEGKISESYAQSIIGYSKEAAKGFVGLFADSMNDWQGMLDQYVKMFAKSFAEGDKRVGIPKGVNFPVLFGIDSIMGANLKEMDDRISKNGFAGRDMPVNALSLTNYLKKAANDIKKHPFNLLLINHRKESLPDPSDPYKPVTATKAGGQHVRFQATYELILHKVSHKILRDPHPDGAADIHRRTVRIDNGKNSAGTDGNSIEVDVSWRFRRIGKELRQVTIWHWDAAIPQMVIKWHEGKLYRFEKRGKSTAGRMQHMDRFFHLRQVSGGSKGKLYYSDTLGVPKSDALNAEQMGRLISDSPEAIKGLREAFAIPSGIIWEPGVTDFYKMREKVKKDERSGINSYLRKEEDFHDMDDILREDEARIFTGKPAAIGDRARQIQREMKEGDDLDD